MWLAVTVPAFSTADADVRVARVHAADGDRLPRGQALFDLTVDLSAGVVRDCPPVSTCRIVLREETWLRRLCVEPGDKVAPGQSLALLSSEADEPSAAPAREARVTAATMLHHADWWATET
jgi:pyruvate/2-oxoglutarate dehydrogenase complex dihydrolipoamide acyltransferase (E2) component